MLAMLCERRRVVGMDYDAEKVETASQSFLRRPGIEFIHADLRTAELPGADAFLLVDVLHYMRPEEQRALIGAARHGSTQADGSSSATATAARPSGTRPRR